MTLVRRRRSRAHLIAALAIMGTLLVPSAGSAQSIDEAREQRVALQERLDDAAVQLDEVETRVAELEASSAVIADQVVELNAEADAASVRINERVRSVFMRGSSDPVLSLLTSDQPAEALGAATFVSQLVRGDRDAAEVAIAARKRADGAAEELALQEDELALARAAQQDVMDSLAADFEVARALEVRLVEEDRARRAAEERRRQQEAAAAAAAAAAQAEAAATAAAAAAATGQTAPSAPAAPAAPAASAAASLPSSGGIACPVGNPHSFSDTWGAARSGGRGHKGVDILSPYNTPVHAFVSGVWNIRSPGNLAGNWAILRGDDGNTYYYMHLTRHTVGNGARVSAGQQTGTIGDTGNARGTPHLHWEVHPGGGGAVNPTPYARRACG